MPAKQQPSPPPDDLEDADYGPFKKLYEQARKAHRKQGKNASSDDPAHLEALAFAEAREWKWAPNFLDALRLAYARRSDECLSLLAPLDPPSAFLGEALFLRGVAYWDLKDFDSAIDCYRKALDSPEYSTPGNAWNGMGLAHAGRRDFDCAIDCYRKALDSPGYDTPGTAWSNMGNAQAGKKDFDSAIDCYRKTLDSPGFDTPGNAWHGMGLAHAGKEDFDSAIDCYRKALDSPGFDTPGDVWHNMGIAQAGKEDFDSAIDCYRKALDSPGFNTPGNTWIGIGLAHASKKDFNSAIDCYSKALDSPEYDTPGRAWNNMGNAQAGKKDFDSAIDSYRKTLDCPDYDSPQMARLNLSLSLIEKNRTEEAKSEILRVLAEQDIEGQHPRARRLLSLLEARERDITPKAEEEALVAPTPKSMEGGPEERMKNTLLGKETRYDEYLARVVDDHPDDLTILRGWSSSVTLLEGGTDCQWQGGGYFLKWQGKGIAIDPGFDFLDNFHEAGFHGKEVQAVLVSHNHPDHNADLKSLDDLCYELSWRSKEIPKSFFAMDEDTAARFPDNSPAHRGAPMKFTRGDYEHRRWHVRPLGLDLTVEHFPMEHGDEVKHAMGLRLRLHRPDGEKDLVIGYTADGKFTDSLVEQLQGVDLLIAHVSQPDTREFNDPEFLKEVHLGYNGVIKLVRAVKPKLTLVGEFWAGLADLRLDLIAGIRLRSGVAAVLPACMGLSLRLPDLTVRCTSCGSQVPHSRIKVTPPTREFGLLGYLCPECIL